MDLIRRLPGKCSIEKAAGMEIEKICIPAAENQDGIITLFITLIRWF